MMISSGLLIVARHFLPPPKFQKHDLTFHVALKRQKATTMTPPATMLEPQPYGPRSYATDCQVVETVRGFGSPIGTQTAGTLPELPSLWETLILHLTIFDRISKACSV